MSGSKLRGEEGNMLPLVVVCALVLFAVLSFAIDQSIAYAAKARQENVLDTVRASCMDASFALAAKNSDDPGRAVSQLVAKTVRGEGFAGRATVWFYEAPEAALPSSERLWAVGVQLEENAPTVFARGFGVESLPVASHRVLVAAPYASQNVWRPESASSGRYEISEGIDRQQATFYPIGGLDGFPDEVVAEVRASLPEGVQLT